MIFKRWSGWSKYYRCWIIPAGKTCRSLNLTKRFPFTHYNIPWLHLILTVMIPYMKYYTSIPNQLPFVEKNFPYWKMSLQNLGQECWDCLCRRVCLLWKKKSGSNLDACHIDVLIVHFRMHAIEPDSLVIRSWSDAILIFYYQNASDTILMNLLSKSWWSNIRRHLINFWWPKSQAASKCESVFFRKRR